MSALNLKDLQNKLLKFTLRFDNFCKKNKLNYFLIGGNLIGAVRHKGFIPWDDDIDVAMPYDDYNKLYELRQELPNGMSILKCQNYSIGLVLTSKEKNIFIDICCLDKITNSNKVCQFMSKYFYYCLKLVEHVQKLDKFFPDFRGKYAKKKKYFWWIYFFHYFFKIIFLYEFLNFIWQKIINPYKLKSFDYISIIFLKPLILTNLDIFPIKYVQYENSELPILNNYHKFLTYYFGDYMTPPSDNLRKPHHIKDL